MLAHSVVFTFRLSTYNNVTSLNNKCLLKLQNKSNLFALNEKKL